jgi:hypothetical protein
MLGIYADRCILRGLFLKLDGRLWPPGWKRPFLDVSLALQPFMIAARFGTRSTLRSMVPPQRSGARHDLASVASENAIGAGQSTPFASACTLGPRLYRVA